MPFRPFETGAKIKRMAQKLKDPKQALNIIGLMMVAESQRAFKDQAWEGKAWLPRGKVNTFGIINDLSLGRSIPKRRFDQRPALMDTGLLMKSISHRVRGTYVEVGTKVKYAQAHQKGGATRSETVTKSVQKQLWAWLQKKANKKWQPNLGWLLNRKLSGKKIDGRVPARPFLGLTKAMKKLIPQVIADMLESQKGKRK